MPYPSPRTYPSPFTYTGVLPYDVTGYKVLPRHYKLRPADPRGERLWLYYGIDKGVSILKNQDGSYYQTEYPTTDQIDACAVIYMGGHETPITADEATALANAGYADCIFDNYGDLVVIPGAPAPSGPSGPTDPGSGDGSTTPSGYGVAPYGAYGYGT